MPNPSSDKPDLSPHPLVARLLGGSDTPPDLVTVTGCLGPSKNMDSVRLYTDASFQSYLEIPKAAIVATTPIDAKDELSPTIVHVKAGTHVEAVHTSTQPVESFLQGGITGAYQSQIDGTQPVPWVIQPQIDGTEPLPWAVQPTPTVTIGLWCAWHSLRPACPPRFTHPPMCLAEPVAPEYGIPPPLGTERPSCPPKHV